MQNAWNVQFIDDGTLKVKVFEGESPKESGALEYAKQLKKNGHPEAALISRRSGFPPPLKHTLPPRLGMLWCPYCIKWQDFEQASIIRDGLEGPELLRCPVCTISVRDYYVRKYNSAFYMRYEVEQEIRKQRAQEKRKTTKIKRRR